MNLVCLLLCIIDMFQFTATYSLSYITLRQDLKQ